MVYFEKSRRLHRVFCHASRIESQWQYDLFPFFCTNIISLPLTHWTQQHWFYVGLFSYSFSSRLATFDCFVRKTDRITNCECQQQQQQQQKMQLKNNNNERIRWSSSWWRWWTQKRKHFVKKWIIEFTLFHWSTIFDSRLHCELAILSV